MPKQSETDMNARRSRILKAAIDVFLRFGFAKTTMGDIAKKAGLHRPVLYALFPQGKEEIFEASLCVWVGEIIDGYEAEVRELGDVRKRILFCAEHWCVEGFQLTGRYPDARDAFNIAYPAVRKMYGLLTAFYADLLREEVERSSLGLSAEQFAELLVFSLRGVRQLPNDVDGMKDVVGREVDVFLAALLWRSDAGTR